MLKINILISGLLTPALFSPIASAATINQIIDSDLSRSLYAQADFYQRQQEAFAGYHNQIMAERQAEYNRQQNELARIERIRQAKQSARASIPELEDKKDYLNLARAWRTLEEWNKSLDAVEKAIVANPTVVNGYVLRAFLRKNLNDMPGALADYDHAIALESDFHGYYKLRGRLKKSFDQNGAIQDFRMAMKVIRVDNRYSLIRDSELKILAKELRSLGATE